ncbi:MAG: hypothetical protein K2N73_07870 [Lachnospiraceae bacterium]|nr:hypothetical protein [Lachnospiraceae bacterium]
MYLQMERKSLKIPLNHKKDIQRSQSSQKKTIFNKCGNACIQRAAGDLLCGAKVWYVDKKGKNCETSFRTGVNNGAQGSVSAVLDTCDR